MSTPDAPTAPDAVLAIDLGGTNLRAGVLPAGHDPAATKPIATLPAPRNLDALEAAVADLRRAAEAVAPIGRVGLAVPGTAAGSRATWVPKLPYLDAVELDARFGLPTTVGNDAQLALLGEVTAGAAVGLRDVVLLALGTGIGSAVLADGRIVTGAHGAACSFGWLSLDPDDHGHPRDGWLERHAAGTSLDAAARTLDDPAITDGAALVHAAADGRPDARDAILVPARLLGTAIAAAVALLDPARVLLAGGVADAFGVQEPHLREAIARHTPAHLRAVEIGVGRFGSRAGLIGAAVAGRRGPTWMEVDG